MYAAQSTMGGNGLTAADAKDPMPEIVYGLRSPNFSTRVQAVKQFAELLPAVLVEENVFVIALNAVEDVSRCDQAVLTQAVNDAVAYLNVAAVDLYIDSDIDRMTQIAFFFNLLGKFVDSAARAEEAESAEDREDEIRELNVKLLAALVEVASVKGNCNERLAEADAENAGLRVQLSKKDDQIRSLHKELSELEAECEDAAEDARDAECKVEELENRLADANLKINDLNCRHSELISVIENDRNERDELAADLNDELEQSAQVARENAQRIEQLGSDLAETEQELADLREEHLNLIEEREAEHWTANAEEEHLRQENTKLAAECADAKAEEANLREQLEDALLDTQIAWERVNQYTKECAEVNEALARKDQLLQEMHAQMKVMQEATKDLIARPKNIAEAVALCNDFVQSK